MIKKIIDFLKNLFGLSNQYTNWEQNNNTADNTNQNLEPERAAEQEDEFAIPPSNHPESSDKPAV